MGTDVFMARLSHAVGASNARFGGKDATAPPTAFIPRLCRRLSLKARASSPACPPDWAPSRHDRSRHRHRRLHAWRVMPCRGARRTEEVVDEILRHLAPELRTVHGRMAEVHPAKHARVHDFLLDVVEFVVRPDRW